MPRPVERAQASDGADDREKREKIFRFRKSVLLRKNGTPMPRLVGWLEAGCGKSDPRFSTLPDRQIPLEPPQISAFSAESASDLHVQPGGIYPPESNGPGRRASSARGLVLRHSRAASARGRTRTVTPRGGDPCCGTDGGDGDGQGPQNRPEALMSAPQAKKILA